MRTTPLLGTKLWFGPRRHGWGWRPMSWEGWAVVLGAGVGSLVLRRYLRNAHPERAEWETRTRWIAGAVTLGAMVAKGTAPGGARRAAELDALLAD